MRPRFSLFLLLCVTTALCCAFAYWHYRANGRRAYLKSEVIEGFLVYSMWKVENQNHSLLYILAFPDGNKVGGGTSTDWESRPGPGVFCNPQGIFVSEQNRLSEKDKPSAWIYLTSEPGGDIRKLEVSPENLKGFTPAEFESLATSKLWQDELRTPLVDESICFSEWYEKTHGTRLRPRFTRSGP